MKQNSKKKHQATSSPASSSKKKADNASLFANLSGNSNFYSILIALVVFAVLVIRWRFVNMPLERDEGEYAYFGHLILNGITPYTEAYNMKLPGIYYMYALIMAVFGESYRGIHIGFVLLNAGTMVLFFYALKHFFSPMTAVLTAGFYGLMGMSMHVLGFAAHATHFSVFYVALSLFFFSKYEQKKTLLYAMLTGGMLGMSFLMKQQAVYFILFGGIVFLIFEFMEKPVSLRKITRNIFAFSAGVFIPYALVLLVMLVTGTFDKFWFWTVQYAGAYVSGVPWSQGRELLSMTFTPIWNEFKWIWILAIAGALIVSLTKFTLKQKIVALAFSLFAFLTTTPGFFFRQHYFVVFLPAGAMMAAIALDFAGQFIIKQIKVNVVGLALPLIVFFLLFNSVLSGSKWYYSTENPVGLCKAVYGTNPFTESVEIAKYINANSSDTDRIAVLGSEPQISFYADRKSATGHIYTYGLMEIHEYNLKMQEEMIAEIEKNKPLFLVFCNISMSWLSQKESPMKIFEWYGKYSQENYNIVGLVDIPDQGPSSIYWGADANRNPKNQNSVWVFKRKEEIKK
ncbi:MAG: hypothetical protein EPN85_04795 [Bacteroidetes bacterium]|nr:MAG: hypothetical protein EPN85_04795 [Bacteroidota bacterium]